MDISKVTDINQLKALAYDQLTLIDQAQRALKMLQQRVLELQSEEAAKEPVKVEVKDESDGQ